MQKVRIQFAYKAGFRRAWAVVSVLWLIVIFLMGTVGMPHYDGAQLARWMLIPPITLYILGAATVWIIEGFARAD